MTWIGVNELNSVHGLYQTKIREVDFDRKAVGEVDVDSEDAGIWKCVLQKAVKCGITEKAVVKRGSETAGNLRSFIARSIWEGV
jgi:hypothetical protein